MPTPKLDRTQPHAINAHQGDKMNLWDSPFQEDRQNLTVQDEGGNKVLTVYGLTRDQLAALYLEIGCVLGKSPEPTVHHLKQIHEKIGTLIKEAEPVRPSELEDEFRSAEPST